MPLRRASASISSGSRLPSIWMWSSAFGNSSTNAAPFVTRILLDAKNVVGAILGYGIAPTAILFSLRLCRQLALDAFGQPIHAGDVAVAEHLAVLHLEVAVLVLDRTLENNDLAALDAVFRCLRRRLHIVRHVGIGRHLQHLALQPAPDVPALPGAVDRRLHALDVVGSPVVNGRGQLGLGSEGDHVARLAEAMDPALLGDLQRRARIRMLRDEVGALIDERLGGVALLAGIVPAVDPDDFDLAVRTHRPHADRDRVHAHDDLGNGDGADIADDARLRHLAGDHALDVAALVEADVVGGDVVGPLVAGGVLELHIREVLGHLEGRVHEAEGGGEDDAMAGRRQLADHALGVRPLLDAFDIGGLHLVAQGRFHRLAAIVMLVEEALGDKVKTTYVESVKEGPDAE